MRYSRVLVVTLPFMLVGCFDMGDDDSGSFYAPTPILALPPVAAPVAKPSPAPAEDHGCCGCSGSGKDVATSAVTTSQTATSTTSTTSTPVDPDWYPSEGQLVRAGELVMELKRNEGGKIPSHAAMVSYIQTHMALTAPKAEKILEELGI